MLKENALIVFIMVMVLVQAAGIPMMWKTGLTAGAGILAAILALAVRHRVAVLERELESHHSHSTFVEN